MSSFLDIEKKLVFIHIPKTGGSAITNFICPTLPDFDGIANPKQKFARFGRYHWPALKIRTEFPDIYNNITSFAIVRDPFSWLQSRYYHYVQRKESTYHEIAINKGFDYTIRLLTEEDDRNISKFVCDKNENIIVEKIFKFENFENEVIPFLKNYYLFDHLPQKNVTIIKKNKIHHDYDIETFNYVYKNYEKDICLFDYHKFCETLKNKIINI